MDLISSLLAGYFVFILFLIVSQVYKERKGQKIGELEIPEWIMVFAVAGIMVVLMVFTIYFFLTSAEIGWLG